MDILKYIENDLKQSNITDYHVEFYQLTDLDNNFPDGITATNKIIYITLIVPINGQIAVINSYDFDIKINKKNETIFKFLSDITFKNFVTINLFIVTPLQKNNTDAKLQ